MIFISYRHAIVLHFCSGYFHRCVLLGDHLCFPFVWLFFVSFGKNVYSVNGCSAIALVMHLFVITIVFRLAFVIVYIYPVPVFFMFSGNQLHWSKRALAQYLLALRFFPMQRLIGHAFQRCVKQAALQLLFSSVKH